MKLIRNKASGALAVFLLLIFISASALALSGDDITVDIALSGRGLTSTVAFHIDSRAQEEASLRILDIAFNGECTGTQEILAVQPGSTQKSLSFTRSQLLPVTQCTITYQLLDKAGKVIGSYTKEIYPYGSSAARKPQISDYPDATVAYDGEDASLLILKPSPASGERTLCLLNKTVSIMRMRIDHVYADGMMTDISLMIQALPWTVQFAVLTLPDPLPDIVSMSLSAYTDDAPEQVLVSGTYEYRLASPVSAPTMVPVNTPVPRIGTVVVRKSGPVNVREADNTSARKVGSAKAGQSYPCYGISPAGWYLIRLEDGTQGYITNTLSTLQRD